MPVGKLGPEDVQTIDRDATVSEAVDQLDSQGVGALVVEEDGKPVGVVTDRDIALAVNESDDVAAESVESVMTENPVTIHQDEEAMQLSRVIEENNVRRVPIVDDDGQLVGIATTDDLVAAVGEQLENIADTIEAQSPDYSP